MKHESVEKTVNEREIHICEYMKKPFDDAILLDIRDAFMYSHGTLPDAVHFPLDRIGELYQLPRDRVICVFCQAGEASREITELLLDAGYDAWHLSGGYREYLREKIREEAGEEGEAASQQ